METQALRMEIKMVIIIMETTMEVLMEVETQALKTEI